MSISIDLVNFKKNKMKELIDKYEVFLEAGIDVVVNSETIKLNGGDNNINRMFHYLNGLKQDSIASGYLIESNGNIKQLTTTTYWEVYYSAVRKVREVYNTRLIPKLIEVGNTTTNEEIEAIVW